MSTEAGLDHISDPSRIELSNNEKKEEEKIKANLWRIFYEKGIWCTLEEIKKVFDSEKDKFVASEHAELTTDQKTVMAQELTAWESRIKLMETIEAYMSIYLIEKGLVINSKAKKSLIPFNMIENMPFKVIEDNFKLFNLIENNKIYRTANMQLFFHSANSNSKFIPVVVNDASPDDTIEELKIKYYKKSSEQIQKALTVSDIRMQYPIGTFLANDRKVKGL